MRYTFACVFLFVSGFSTAQNCSQILDQAKSDFQEGNLYGIPDLLAGCLSSYDRGQRVEAYELLTLTYLFTDEHEKAEESYLKLLQADPEWRPGPGNEIEIEYLSKKFTTTPIWTLYPAKVGGNFSHVQVINVNGTDNTLTTQQNYRRRFGFQVGAGADWNLSSKFSLAGEVYFTSKNYRFTNHIFGNPPSAGVSQGDSLVIDYSSLGFDVPVYLRYTMEFVDKSTGQLKKYAPFVYVGYVFHYNLDNNAKPEYYDINGDVVNPDAGRTLNIGHIRNNMNHSITGGVGVRYRIGYRYIMAEVRYSVGLKNQLNVNNQFDFGDGDSQDPIREYTFNYTMVDDDFRLNQLMFNVGYVYPLYKPRKKTKRKRLFGKKKSGDEE